MNDSKLIQILKTFSVNEIKDFEKFIASPYFSTGRNVEGLYSILKPYHPEFDSPKLDKKTVFKKLFPGEKYSEMKFKNVTTALTRLAEQFIINESFKNDPLEFESKLFNTYWNRENLKLFAGTMNSLEKKIDKLPFDHDSAFILNEKIASLKYSYFLKINRHDKAIPLIGKAAEYNALTFLTRFIKSINYRSKVSGTYKAKMENTLVDVLWEGLEFERILANLRKRKYPYLWLLELYYYTNRFYSNPDDTESFHKARDVFNKNIEKYSRIEKYFVLNDFYSYCIQRFSKGDNSFIRMEFEICKQLKDENALTSADYVSLELMNYRNVVYSAIKAKEYDWLENFIKDCTPLLRPDGRDNMKNFALSKLEFERGKFENALEYASKIQYDMFTYKLDIKNLLLMIYYELGLLDQAESLIATYKHYVKYNKDFSRNYMRKFKNFITIYSSLFKARSTANTKDMDLLLKRAEDMDVLPSRAWFTRKIKELQK